MAEEKLSSAELYVMYVSTKQRTSDRNVKGIPAVLSEGLVAYSIGSLHFIPEIQRYVHARTLTYD